MKLSTRKHNSKFIKCPHFTNMMRMLFVLVDGNFIQKDSLKLWNVFMSQIIKKLNKSMDKS